MSETNDLNRLSALAGIEDGWWDFFGTYRVVSEETKRAFLTAMGFAVDSPRDLAASLAEFETRPWRRWVEPVTVSSGRDGGVRVALTLPPGRENDPLEWAMTEEAGGVHRGVVRPADLPVIDERWIDGLPVRRRAFQLLGVPPPGYHRLRFVAGDGGSAETAVIVVPQQAYAPAGLIDGERIWGVAAQTYSLRGARDWGLGDYSTLRDFAAMAGRLGAGAVGVNPLHALFANRPERFSPYAPSSRVLTNVAYLDVEAIPDFAECDEARRLASAQAGRIAALRERELIDYPGVWAVKRPVLEALYASFRTRHLAGERGGRFRQFQQQGGRTAELYAIFEALQETFLARDPHFGYWRHWPEDYRDPANPAVAGFAVANRERVEFFWYLQWQADLQLSAVKQACDDAAMPVGLYRDLGVGIADDGAEAWAQQGLLALGVTIGAPPDPLNLKGQDWGLAPFNPVSLGEAAYRPFRDVLAANMRHAGAMRLDHAMSLQRLYWVPAGAAADQGAYVQYPVADMFGLVALESRRNRCLVIGEDLGTVPDGFRERMFDTNIFAYRVLYFERRDDGIFRGPSEYSERALVTVGTHDMASLGGWWSCLDLDERERLTLYPRDGMVQEERHARAEARRRLVEALQGEDLLPPGFPTGGELTAAQMDRLSLAAHLFIARTPSRIMMVQLEDVLGLTLQMNLPGTTDQHPNWRRRLPGDVDSLVRDPRLVDMALRLLDSRCTADQSAKVESNA